MKKTTQLIKLFIFVFIFITYPICAQLELGIQGGRSYFEGDAHCWEDSKITPFTGTGGAFGAFVRYLFLDRRLGARLNYAYLPLKFDERRFGSLTSHVARGFNGKNKASDLSLELSWNILPRKKLNPYIFAGLGAQFSKFNINWDESRRDGGQLALITRDKNLPKTNFILPVGAGLQWQVNNRLKLHVEHAIRLPNSDNYDGISNAGNPNKDDWYGYGMVGLSYLIKNGKDTDKDGIVDRKDKCPTVPGYIFLDGCPDEDRDGITDLEDRCPQLAGVVSMKGCPDKDMDGIVDMDDECPDVKGILAFKGCPDTDGDGITDKLDECPDQKGIAEMNGCPDTDDDGIADKNDKCPNQIGSVAMSGCPDSDGDGIADPDDKCPQEPGIIGYNGCLPLDTDKDGIPDAEDNCPNEVGLVATKGCPAPDADKDGVPDDADKCPTLAGIADYGGCPYGVKDATVPATPTKACVACNTSADPIFSKRNSKAKKLSRLGTNPEFGNIHDISPEDFYNKLKKAYVENSVDKAFLDRLYKGMGYTGFDDARPEHFTSVILPLDATGNLGYGRLHRTGIYTLPDDERDRMAFRVLAANGCDMHFMKTCGNHFFFCQ
jgi:hypothetical protein